jgi:hypothetical protein
VLLVVLVSVVGATGSWAATHKGSQKAARRSAPTAPALSVLPVVSCPTIYGAGTGSGPFVAHQLPSTANVRGLSFYSNGLITVLGPAGWSCAALVAADGGQKLDVYAPGSPDYSETLAPKGASLIEVDADYTGHGPGAEVVCALFPHSAAATSVTQNSLSCPVPSGQVTVPLTSDVMKFTDPPGVTGSGAGSGGVLTSTGAAVYPQLLSASNVSVNVSLLSCTLPKKSASLCRAILGDYLVRNPPVFVGATSG